MAESELVAKTNREITDLISKVLGKNERSKWQDETISVSTNIWKSLIRRAESKDAPKIDGAFLDYCNMVKSLLVVCNFGTLSQEQVDRCKNNIKEGVQNIIGYVNKVGYSFTPYLEKNDCMEIFGNDDNTKIEVPITFSYATVLTTLVYFRRAYKRLKLFSDAELGENLMNDVSCTVSEIMTKFVEFAEKNDYQGWGFTLDSERTPAVTLNDTYAVVDAISRFEDAFNKEEANKRDQEFLDMVNAAARKEGENQTENLTDRCANAMYSVAYNTYMRDKDADNMYGRNIFFAEKAEKSGANSVGYRYSPITVEQLASSNRASALFNPLYLAMITMYGYNEKEVVIRKFMKDKGSARRYYERYELGKEGSDEDKISQKGCISQYIRENINGDLKWYRGDFESDVEFLTKTRPDTAIETGSDEWKRLYNIARVFQKFLEKKNGKELEKIDEYRDYLNATKDAIDQVQVAYRKLDDKQRLGIVDTDYLMFSKLDFNTDDSVVISKLNKAGIAVNYLRPMLLSSKIMIVNALTTYPQSDMEKLYDAIIESKYRKIVRKNKLRNDSSKEEQFEWLWNEDEVNMNATARHCEAIMYDYFDYYEKYELSYKTLNGLREYNGAILTPECINDDGSLNFEELTKNEALDGFKQLIWNFTNQNLNQIRENYNDKLQKSEKNSEAALKEKEDEIAALRQQIEELKKQNEDNLNAERKRHKQELDEKKISLDIGDTVRGWICSEYDRHLQEMLTCMILNNINKTQTADSFKVSGMMSGKNSDEIVSGKFATAEQMAKKIMDDFKRDSQSTEQEYRDRFVSAIQMQRIFEGAFNVALKSIYSKKMYEAVNKPTYNLKDKNEYVLWRHDKIQATDAKNKDDALAPYTTNGSEDEDVE